MNKYDLETGKIQWASEQFKAAKAVPNMFVIQDKVIVQVGGVAENKVLQKEEKQTGQFLLLI